MFGAIGLWGFGCACPRAFGDQSGCGGEDLAAVSCIESETGNDAHRIMPKAGAAPQLKRCKQELTDERAPLPKRAKKKTTSPETPEPKGQPAGTATPTPPKRQPGTPVLELPPLPGYLKDRDGMQPPKTETPTT
eukprot:7966827-Alexandrium_andersonii.AAC.1